MKDAKFIEFLSDACELCQNHLNKFFIFFEEFITNLAYNFIRKSNKMIRAGFSGHLTKIANNFVKLSEKDDDLKSEMLGS